MAYFDSGVLVKLYTPEHNSHQAIALVQRFPSPILISRLHESEIKNALRLKCYRKEISVQALSQSLEAIQADFERGVLERMAVDWVEMFREADSLSAAHAIETNCRTLDLFHVACAVILHSDAFASFDQRQRSVAARAGLQVVPETS